MKCPSCERETTPVPCCSVCHTELGIGDCINPAELLGLIEKAEKGHDAGQILWRIKSYLSGDIGPLEKLGE